MCYVTNLDHITYGCKSACPKTCRNITFTWLNWFTTSTKSRDIIGLTVGCSYSDNVTVNRYNRHIKGTNCIVRHVLWPICMLERMYANQYTLKHAATQTFHDLNMAKPHILLNGQYWQHLLTVAQTHLFWVYISTECVGAVKIHLSIAAHSSHKLQNHIMQLWK